MPVSRRVLLLLAGSQLLPAPEALIGDDTVRLQKLIDAAPSPGIVDGYGRSYVVTRLLLKSNLTFRNFNLRAKGTATPLDAVLTIDGNAHTAHDITINNVQIDGNRSAQTNLASEEDGGRDGIRIVGKAQRISISNCTASNCATDGLKIFSHNSLSDDDTRLNFYTINVVNCTFNGNRRHGASGDSLRNVYFTNCEFSGNGLDIPGDFSEGGQGARNPDQIYGAGIDIEGYGVGSGIDGLNFSLCTALGNARFGFQFWDPTPPSSPRFQPRGDIFFDTCTADGGVGNDGHQALEFSEPPAVRGGPPTYQDITIRNMQCTGTISLYGVDDITFNGGRYRSPYPGFWGVGQYVTNIRFQNVDCQGKIFSLT